MIGYTRSCHWICFWTILAFGGSFAASNIRPDFSDFSLSDETIGDDILTRGSEGFKIIFPGTKWCGSGDIAANYEDLGRFTETDACCREHDHCDDIIDAKETKHNLTNPDFHTRLECSCDEKFYDCLHRSGDKAANKVGFLYFSLLNTQCFRKDYPIVKCKTSTSYLRRCLEYELNERQPKVYQWFDVPPYSRTKSPPTNNTNEEYPYLHTPSGFEA
ncbi:phospholipase A2-like [Prorops nasuta]|uniref:phospholipase A2-like n=1 Tax=Prorops nasuta TaxID=863751 RepID=UPI0034CE15F9